MTNHSTHWQGRTLGRYRLIQLLGQGAMGEVWLAEDSQLHRQVAMKLLPPVLANDQNYLHLFAYEARTAASLDHAHILAVHDFGEQAGNDGEVITYLVMPYINGGTLRERIRAVNGPLPTGEALHYLRQAAQAIDYAHSRGVIHRDIKPANMLLQQYWLWLSDFGIAKLLTSNTYRSQTTAGAGTPEFIAPEQAQGHAQPASDRYSLAIMAYQMFAGRVPFKGETSYNTMLMQIRDPAPSPRQFNKQIPFEVEKVILKGIAKQPAERYTSCIEFVQMLERAWKAGEQAVIDEEATDLAPWSKRLHSNPLVPISVPPTIERHLDSNVTAAPAIQQMPPIYTPLPSNMPTLSPSSGGIPSQEHKQTPGRRKLLVGGATAAAALLVGGGALAAYVKYNGLVAAQSKPTPPPGPRDIMTGQAVLNLTGHTNTIWNVAWDSTGRYLATAGDDTHVMVWDVGPFLQKNSSTMQPLNKPLKDWKFAQTIMQDSISWSADGRSLIVSADEENKLYAIDVFKPNSQPQPYTDTTPRENPFDAPSYNGLSWRPHTNTFTTTNYYAPQIIEIGLWKWGNAQNPIRKFTYSISNATALQNFIDLTAWSSDGSLLATINNEAQTIIWNGNTGKQVYFLDPANRVPPGKEVDSVLMEQIAWSPVDPHMIATFDLDVVAVWDVRKKQPFLLLGTDDPAAHTPPANKNDASHWFPNLTGIAWSPNGRYIIAGYGRSTSLSIWDLQDTHARTAKDGSRLQKLLFPPKGSPNGHNNTVTDIAWSPDGRYVASASFDTTVIVWRVDRD